jgi:hypothetical protein
LITHETALIEKLEEEKNTRILCVENKKIKVLENFNVYKKQFVK